MVKRNNYWVDENNNKWNCYIYSKEEAEKYSKTLISCSYCSDCRDCSDCSGCSYCRVNPQRYVTPKIGSRSDNTYYYFGGKIDQIVCGCYKGTLKEFKERVESVYGKEKHGEDYMKQVGIMEYLVKQNEPPKEEE